MNERVPALAVAAAGWWTADSGPVRAHRLPRAERMVASLPARAAVHAATVALDAVPSSAAAVPMVIAAVDPTLLLSCRAALAHCVRPGASISMVVADRATVAMALFEAFGVAHEQSCVLVVFVQSARIPHTEVAAAALLLQAEDGPILGCPQLRRGRPSESHPDAAAIDPAVALARAAAQGDPTSVYLPWPTADESQSVWSIDLHPPAQPASR